MAIHMAAAEIFLRGATHMFFLRNSSAMNEFTAGKKNPERNESIRGFPFFILKTAVQPLATKIADLFVQAGFLTFGLFYLPHLPIRHPAYH